LHCPVKRHCVPKGVVVRRQVRINAKIWIGVKISVPSLYLPFDPAKFWEVHQLCH
jgi:hypothetical protein